MHSLPVFLRLRGARVILVGTGEAAAAKRRLIERAGATAVDEADAAAGPIAFVAADDRDEAAAAHRRLAARGLLVNVADRPELCAFTLPAIVDRDPVIVAIGTGGASAGLAAALRQRLEALLPASLGPLAAALAALLAPGAPLDPLGEPPPDLDAALAGARPDAARVERILVASADPDALTLRAVRLLAAADRLYHPPDMPAALLDRARADAARIPGAAPAAAPAGLSVELAWAR